MKIENKIDQYLNNLNEGTWAYPDSLIKAKEFERIMKTPLPAKKVQTKLRNIIGSDAFYDALDDVFRTTSELEQDARYFIKEWLRDNWLTDKGQKSFNKPWDKKILKLFKRITK